MDVQRTIIEPHGGKLINRELADLIEKNIWKSANPFRPLLSQNGLFRIWK